MAYKAKKRIKYVGQFVFGLLLEIVAIVGFAVLTYYEFTDAHFFLQINKFMRWLSVWDSMINSIGAVGRLVVHEVVYGVIAFILFVIGHKMVKGSRSYV